MPIKRLLGCILLEMLALAAAAQSNYGVQFSSLMSEHLTLENAIRLGLENNSAFLTARQEITIAEQKLSETKFRYLPQFALQGTASWYEADSPMVLPEVATSRFLPASKDQDKHSYYGVGVTATQYIYSGGRINGALKTARANLKQAQSRYETVKNATVLDIKKSFTQLLYAQTYADLTENVWQQVSRWKLSPDAWTRIRQTALLAQLQATAHEAQQELTQARLAMRMSLNKEMNAPLSITGQLAPVSVNGDLAHFQVWAMEFRPELKSAIYALELDSIALDLALSKRYPDILLNAAYERVGDSDLKDENKQVSLAVRLPIPYTFSQQLSQKKAEQRKSTLRRSAIEDTLRQQVASRFDNMVFWQAEAQTRQDTFQTLDKLVWQHLPAASKSGLTVLEALQDYVRVAHAYLQALRENNIAKAELEWAIGKDL